MAKCVYCGGKLADAHPEVKVKERAFPVCSDNCMLATEKYLRRDRKFKLLLYIIILAAALVILYTAISAGNMLPANIAQIVVGIAFVLLPYPISAFTTFESCPVRTVVIITRVIGVFLVVFGAVLVAAALL